ncbi:MAG: sigma-70 family RNA polymerase sigma factor [Gemmataceae bacterium]
MTAARLRSLLPHLHRMATPGVEQTSDSELLARFADVRDEEAFAEVVRRHGPMVWRVCRRVLGSGHAAEDVSQAAFLLLATKASGRWRDSVAGWLYRTASLLAQKARVAAARRARHEARSRPAGPQDAGAERTAREVAALLDEELNQLPDKFRVPVVLCCLEGLSRDEAARRLGWSASAVKDRLKEGRERLRRSLGRRGIELGAVVTPGALAVHGHLVPHAIARAAALFAAGQAGVLSPTVAALVKGGMGAPLTGQAARAALVALTAAALTVAVVAAGLKRPAAAPPHRLAPRLPERVVLTGHKGAVRAIAFAPDGKSVATSGEDKTIRIWDVPTGTQRHRMVRAWDERGLATEDLSRTAVAVGLAYSGDGKVLVSHSTGRYGYLVFWDALKGSERSSIGALDRRLAAEGGAVAATPDGRMVVAGFGKGSIEAYVSGRGEPPVLDSKDGPGGRAAVAVSSDSRRLAVSGGGTVRLLELPTGKALRPPRQWDGPEAITALAFLPGDKQVVAADGAKALRLLDAASGVERRAFKGSESVAAVAVGATDGRVATGGSGGTVSLWTAAGKQERQLFAGGRIHAVTFSRDGRWLATAGDEGTILWNLARDEEVPAGAPGLTAERLAAEWEGLKSDDGGKAYAAARTLRDDPARSVPYLTARLKSEPESSDELKVRRLIADVDAEEFERRDAASKGLREFGKTAVPLMRGALAAAPPLEARRRLERLVALLGGEDAALTAEALRHVRAVRVLEQAGTPEAASALRELSKPRREWWVTREAAAALERLAFRATKP